MFTIFNTLPPALLLVFLSSAWASYDSGPGYGASDQSFPAAPITHGQGWSGGHGHNAGSYYHYHVPLVGQQQQQPHYHPQPQQNDHHHLYLLLPLLLLAALPLLLAPLLPLLLLPLGLSLLALLLPLIMMGGMMMMMMMPGGMMMMMMRNSDHPTRHQYHGDARSIGSYLYDDVSELFGRYARSLDLDHCPERLACEAGSLIFPLKSPDESSAKFLVNYLVDKAVPKGRARRMIRSYEKAFWAGSSSGSCVQHKCQPTFNLSRVNVVSSAGADARSNSSASPIKTPGGGSGKEKNGSRATLAEQRSTTGRSPPAVFYQYPAAPAISQSSYQQGKNHLADSSLHVRNLAHNHPTTSPSSS